MRHWHFLKSTGDMGTPPPPRQGPHLCPSPTVMCTYQYRILAPVRASLPRTIHMPINEAVGSIHNIIICIHVECYGPRPLKSTGRHGHFLNSTGRHQSSDSDIGSNNIVTWDIGNNRQQRDATLAFLKIDMQHQEPPVPPSRALMFLTVYTQYILLFTFLDMSVQAVYLLINNICCL